VPKIFIARENGVTLNIYVQAGASKTGFAGIYNGRLKLKVAAKAIDGEANQAVCDLIANSFSLARGKISIIRGASAREKTVQVEGSPNQLVTTVGQILATLPDAPDEPDTAVEKD
jgi:uncharacterized protein